MDIFTPMWVYIVQCCDGTYYTGVTRNLHNRIQAHNKKHGALYTKLKGPVTLVYSEEYQSHAPAYKREEELKKLSHNQKKSIIDKSSLLTQSVLYETR
jgi:putative endonuclease